MSQDDITRMAREAGGEITSFINYDYGEDVVVFHMADLARFATLVAAAEREACAKVCFREAAFVPDPIDRERIYQCAAIIRARSKE